MNLLILYYSITGNNKKLANLIKDKIDGKAVAIKDKFSNSSGFKLNFLGGIQALLNMQTAIESFEGIKVFDNLILVSPVWAGKLPPGVQTLLDKHGNMIKKLYFASVSGEGSKNKDKVINNIHTIINREPDAHLFLSKKEFKNKQFENKLEVFLDQIS